MAPTKSRFLLKLAAGLFVAGVAVAAAATWALKTYLPPEKVRELVLREAGKALKREVRLGKINLGAIQGLTIEKLEVSELPNFKAGTFVSAERFRVRIKLLPLLSRQIEVSRVSLEGLKVSVTRDAKGIFNFSDLLAASTVPVQATPGGAAAAALPASLRVSQASVSGAEILFRDAEIGTWKVADADLAISDFDLSRPFGAKAKLTVTGKWGARPIDAKLRFAGTIDPAKLDLAAAGVEFDELEASLAGVRVQGSGRLSRPAAPSFNLKGKVWIQDKQILEVEVSSAAMGALQGGGPPEIFADFSVAAKGFSTAGLEFFGVPGGIEIPAGEARGKIAFRGGDLAVEGFRVQSKLLEATASGSILKALSKKPEARLTASFKADFPEIAASSLPFRPKGLPEKLVIPAVQAEGKLRLEDSAEIEAFTAKIRYGDIKLSGSVRSIGSGFPNLDLTASFHGDTPQFKAAELPVTGVPAWVVLPAAKTEGTVRMKGETASLEGILVKTKFGDLTVAGDVRKLTSGKPQPDLTVTVRGETPPFKSADLPGAGLPAGLDIPAFKLDGKARVGADELGLEGFKIACSYGKAEISGKVRKLASGKPEPDLDIAINADIPGIRTQDLPVKGLPALTLPPGRVDGRLGLGADELSFDSFILKNKFGSVKLTGKVAKIISGPPDPKLDLTADLSLPAFKTADLPIEGLPKDWNFPASKWDASFSGDSDRIEIRSVRVVSGSEGAKNDMEVSGKLTRLGLKDPSKFELKKVLFDILVKGRSFYLDQITPITPQTRDLKMKGKGIFAVSVAGTLDKPTLGGKLKFDGMGVSLYGFELSDFSGTATLDDRGIRLPNVHIPRISGKVDGAPLEIDLTVSDYLAAPKIDVDVVLEGLDLEKALAAKAAFLGGGAPAAGGGEPAAAPAVKSLTVDAKRSLKIKRLFHPNAEARDLEARWDLSDITLDLKKISGEAKFRIAGGRFDDLPKVVRREAALKAMALPFMLLSKILKLGKIEFTEAAGLYRFKDGVMTIEDSRVTTSKGDYFVSGSINLGDETVDVRMRSERLFPPVAAVVTGTFENPKTKAGIAVP